MRTRPLGRTGHDSTVAVLGAAAFGRAEQDAVDEAVRAALDAGVNHVDIAPSYGEAELRLAPWTGELGRRGVLIACKTMERTAAGARAELEGSLGRLGRDRFPLYQLHAVGDLETLDAAMDALDGLVRAQEEGLIGEIGITGHGLQAPATHLEALRRFPFATVMFPVYPRLWLDDVYRTAAQELIALAGEQSAGVLAIKAAARRPREPDQIFTTWYEPFADAASITKGIRFALSQPITAVCTPGDVTLLPAALEAAQQFEPMTDEEQAAVVAASAELEPIF